MNVTQLNGTSILRANKAGHFILKAGLLFDGLGDETVQGKDIRILDGVIQEIGEDLSEKYPDLLLMECSDCFVMPGLIETHVHLSGMFTSEPYRRYFDNPDVRLIKALRQCEELLSRGFTTVRDMGGKGKGLSLRQAMEKNLCLCPHIITAIEYISPTAGHADWTVLPYDLVRDTVLRGVIADGVDECVHAVRRLIREGADFVKITTSAGSMAQPYKNMFFKVSFSVEEIAAMSREAHFQQKVISTHGMGYLGIKNALLGGVDMIEHCFYEFERYPEILDLLCETKAVVVPTLSLIKWFQEIEEANGRYEKAAYFDEHMEKHQAFVKKAYDMGVPIVCGSDENGMFGGIGRCAEEYGFLAEAGLPNAAILRGATSLAAKALRIDDVTGSIEPGKRADLLVLSEGNPLVDIRTLQKKDAIRCVVLG